MIIIDEKRIFEIISQRKPVTVALNAPDGMLPQVQETAVNITKKFDIPAFVLADTTWGTCDLNSNGASKSFVNNSNIESGKEFITKMARIRPKMKQTKLENAVGILNWIYDYNHQRPIDKVVWGYREKANNKHHILRKLISYFGGVISDIFLNIKIKDLTSGFYMIRTSVLKAELLKKDHFISKFHFFDTELKFYLKNYSDTDYALDLKFKRDLIINQLAAKELYVAKYYIEGQKWIAAINRFRNVVENYDTTIYVEEALHRLVEIYYRIGLTNESAKYAKLLGYNYGSSEWYKQSYAIFNKDYDNIEKKQTVSKKKKGIIKRFKKLFD